MNSCFIHVLCHLNFHRNYTRMHDTVNTGIILSLLSLKSFKMSDCTERYIQTGCYIWYIQTGCYTWAFDREISDSLYEHTAVTTSELPFPIKTAPKAFNEQINSLL